MPQPIAAVFRAIGVVHRPSTEMRGRGRPDEGLPQAVSPWGEKFRDSAAGQLSMSIAASGICCIELAYTGF